MTLFKSIQGRCDLAVAKFLFRAVMQKPGGRGGSQYLAAQLTLFQPGEGRLSPSSTHGSYK